MRIGLDHRPALSGQGGIAVYVRELVAALGTHFPDDELALYGHRLRRPHGASKGGPLPANAALSESRLPAPLLAAAARGGLGADKLLGAVDVMHLTDYVWLQTSRAPLVATVHDVLFEDLPDCYAPKTRQRLRAVTQRIVRGARHLIVPSEHARTGLLRHFDASPDGIAVIPHGCPTLPEAEPATQYGRYLLFVGTLQPRKNLLRLLAAFDLVRARADDLTLVLAGGRGWLDEEIGAGISSRPAVKHVGEVGRERLSALYRGALAVASPSLGEGFGLPVLEAMAIGCPVLVGAGGASEELAADAAVTVDPNSEGAIAEGLQALVEDTGLRERLSGAGLLRAQNFSWEKSARATHDVYESVIS